MAFRLPPLSSLRVFEAAARHLSFRKAADELNLTASAVSHGVQTLESWLGVELFHRQSGGLRLTAAGDAYAPLVNQALSIIAKATEQLPGRKATGTLSVSSAPTFATKILLPRLEKFATQFPDIRVTLDTSQRLVDLTLDDFDLAIRFSRDQEAAAELDLADGRNAGAGLQSKTERSIRRFRRRAVGAGSARSRHSAFGGLAALVWRPRLAGAGLDRRRIAGRHRANGAGCRHPRARHHAWPAAAGRR
jgi:DNA-binding transcriptional LysR family regulator